MNSNLRKAKLAALMIALMTMGHEVYAAKSMASEPEAIPGEYIVKFKDDISVLDNSKENLSQVLGSYIKSTMPEQNIVVIKRAVVETQNSVIQTLKQNPNIEIVEPNFIYRINAATNDPLLGQLWGMENTGQVDSAGQEGVSGIDIGVVEAWKKQTGSKDVIVAVIDTGINYKSSDLAENMWTNEAELNGKAGVDDDHNGYVDDIHGYNFVKKTGDPLDDHGHGSHCSGTIGAKGNDNSGLVGVAWNVRLMAVKFLSDSGSGSLEDALKAIDYATKNGAKIMSNSWGGGGYSETLKQAIERANKAGALFVAAAGNESNDNDENPSYPASYNIPNVISVAAIDNRGQVASFSNTGKRSVHVVAPGVNIVSLALNEYKSWSGTSMATPHVSGVAALLASEFPQMTNVEMKNRILATARPLPGLRKKVSTGGLVNAFNALTNTSPTPDENDPSRWASKSVSVSTKHPYKDGDTVTFNLKVDGAKQISVYFEKFETEIKYDVVTLYDSNGKVVQTLTGDYSDSYSNIIEGDSVKVVFKTDNSQNSYGFDIKRISYR